MTGGNFSRRVRSNNSPSEGEAPVEGAPLGGTKTEAAQRLQVGLFGIASMVLVVGLASILGNRADLTEEGSVPEAAPTTEPTAAVPQRDPLADAGIVPEIPAEPIPQPSANPADDQLNPPPVRVEDSDPTGGDAALQD